MVWSRRQPHGLQGGILQEANASGKARGYADVETMTEKVTLLVAKWGNPWINAHLWWSDEKETITVLLLLQTRSYQALAWWATYH